MEFMEIKQEHRDFLDANINNYESAQNGYIRNLDLPELQMYEHIYRLYLDPNFLLSVWCGACKFDMIMRLYNWYIAQPKSSQLENKEEDAIITFIIEEPKKRGRKPKANG
jgi:hypothetical protein